MLQKQHVEIIEELKVSRTEKNTRQQTKEEHECHQAFRTSDYEAYKKRNPDKVAGTCRWFLDHPNYNYWLENPGSGLLWISADPGCGKSVLSKSLIDKELCSTDVRTTCYFFFKDNLEQGSATKAVCALLHQLFLQKRSLIRHGVPVHAQNGFKLPDLFDPLWAILTEATADPEAGEVICIVDALDECEESGRKRFIHALNEYYCENGKYQASSLKFLVTSRPYFGIELAFDRVTSQAPTIRLAGEDETGQISKEINLVIKDRVAQIGRKLHLGESVSASLENTLLSAPQRTYLWLHLVLDQFEEPGLTEMEVKAIINTLPQTVYEAYDSILDKIKAEKRKQARKLLHIMVAAARPLSLREMNIALAIEDGRTTQDPLPDDDVFRKRVRNLCGLFVSVFDNHIYLIHQTAKEYLVDRDGINSKRGLWQHSLIPRESNLVVAKVCTSYLLSPIFENFPLLWQEDEDRAVSRYVTEHGFLQYAAQYWDTHLREADTPDPQMLTAALALVNNKSYRFLTWFRVARRNALINRSDWNNLLVASYLGLQDIVALLLANPEVDPNFQNHNGDTPLSVAAGEGQKAVVILLLANPEVDPNLKYSMGNTLLFRAAFLGQDDIVALLLANPKVDPDLKNNAGETPLFIAAKDGNKAIITLLLANTKVDPNSKDNEGKTPLWIAALLRKNTVVALLLANSKVDPDLKNNEGETPLFAAAMNGDKAIVTLLLANTKVDPNNKDNKGRTPLWIAAAGGNDTVVALLLANTKVDPNARNNYGNTPLWITARMGKNTTVALLLANTKVNPHSENNRGRTPLSVAGTEAVAALFDKHFRS